MPQNLGIKDGLPKNTFSYYLEQNEIKVFESV